MERSSQPPPWARATTKARKTTTITSTGSTHVVNSRRRASTGNPNYREPSLFSSSDDDLDFKPASSATPQPSQPGPALKEAREQSKNNLQAAWESIFSRYTSGQHLAAGRDDVFDFGTGEIVEDAGFLDDFVVEDDSEDENTAFFNGRSIEIGDFGLPGAMGMDDLTESSSEEETPRSSRHTSVRTDWSDSDVGVKEKDDSEDEIQLETSPRRRISASHRPAVQARSRMSRSVSMPESVDLLSSSSDDELGQRDVHPVSIKYKELKRARTTLQEDLKEFEEAENARIAKEEAERVKRERTCTPFLLAMHTPHNALSRAGSSRPQMPRSAPSSYRPHVSSSLARKASVTPAPSSSRHQRYHTPSNSLHISVKPESSSSSSMFQDEKPSFRASSSRPQVRRSFSTKPSSSSSSCTAPNSAGLHTASAIPLGHYSNTLYNQAVACEDESSDDELAIRTPTASKVKQEERSASRMPLAHASVKGKERAKEEDPDMAHGFLQQDDMPFSHLPSPPPSRVSYRKKRSPSFYASPTQSTLSYSHQDARPSTTSAQSPSRPPPSPSLTAHQKHIHPHTVPRLPPSKLDQYRPKQPSPLKGSSNQLHRSRRRSVSPTARHTPGSNVQVPIWLPSDSSDDDGDLVLRSKASPRTVSQRDVPFSSQRRDHHDKKSPQGSSSPTKRKCHFSSQEERDEEDGQLSPMARARLAFPTPPRSSSSSGAAEQLFSPSTPNTPLRQMSLASSHKDAVTLPRRIKEETPSFSSHAKRSETKIPEPRDSTQHISHLPTPPLSSGSATGFPVSCKEETPAVEIKPEEQETFKVPSPPKQKTASQTSPSTLPRRLSNGPTPRAAVVNQRVKEESLAIASDSEDEDDDILLVALSRPATARRDTRTPTSRTPKTFPSLRRNRANSTAHTSPRRVPSAPRSPAKPSPTIMRDRPPTGEEGDSDSDDPLAI